VHVVNQTDVYLTPSSLNSRQYSMGSVLVAVLAVNLWGLAMQGFNIGVCLGWVVHASKCGGRCTQLRWVVHTSN